jgi:hypothetical protein
MKGGCGMPRKGRWPDFETSMENIRKGIIDDTSDAIPPYDLEDWEILGEFAPEGASAAEGLPDDSETVRRGDSVAS